MVFSLQAFSLTQNPPYPTLSQSKKPNFCLRNRKGVRLSMRFRHIVLLLIIIISCLLIFGPFFITIPPLENITQPEELAQSDSNFITLSNIKVHYKIAGKGNHVLVLLHGFGAHVYTWQKVMQPLAENYTVVAYDRTGFGSTSRPMPEVWQGQSPYSADSQADQTIALMDALNIEKAILVGSSAGGTVAALSALKYPDRIEGLILVGPAIFKEGAPRWVIPLLHIPQLNRLGPLFVRKVFDSAFKEMLTLAWHDPSRITQKTINAYKKTLQTGNWDQALWQMALANPALHLKKRLDQLRMPVLVISGGDDKLVPQEESQEIAARIPQAVLVIIPNCGHLPQEETPEEFIQEVKTFMTKTF